MAVVDQYKASTLGLLVRHNVEPQRDMTANPYTYGYSVDGTPSVRLLDFNKNGFSTVKVPSTLDELDILAPKNLQIGAPSTSPGGSVVSQFYKSNPLDQYKSKGPKDGRY